MFLSKIPPLIVVFIYSEYLGDVDDVFRQTSAQNANDSSDRDDWHR